LSRRRVHPLAEASFCPYTDVGTAAMIAVIYAVKNCTMR
jgi:hypothetical protein